MWLPEGPGLTAITWRTAAVAARPTVVGCATAVGLTGGRITPRTRASLRVLPFRAFRDPWQDLALIEVLPVGSGVIRNARRARFLKHSNPRGRDDQAPTVQVQAPPPDGTEYLGPS